MLHLRSFKKTIKAIKEKSIKSDVVEGERKTIRLSHSTSVAGLRDGFTCSVEQMMIYGRLEVSAAAFLL